ncbi:hypothetical protein HF072_00685 [Bacillus sp. RO3]|nr:hypothetical protein [Bacillus sp. RO3]
MNQVKFPLWFTIKYFVDSVTPMDQKIMGHRFLAANEKAVVEKFRENKWSPDNISVLEVNNVVLAPDRRDKFFQWLFEITEKVREEDEARKKTDKESKESNNSGWDQPK